MGDLFDEPQVILEKDGFVCYRPNFLSEEAGVECFESLMRLAEWKSDVVKMFGKTIVTGRKVIWFGDEGCSYKYSGVAKLPVPWHPEVLRMKQAVEKVIGENFNACLANLYHHGEEGMGWHSDDEPELGEEPVIAMISLGAERKFKFKHKQTKQVVDVFLEPGSLLVMKGETQSHWWHSLPKSKKFTEPRISLTYRMIQNS